MLEFFNPITLSCHKPQELIKYVQTLSKFSFVSLRLALIAFLRVSSSNRFTSYFTFSVCGLLWPRHAADMPVFSNANMQPQLTAPTLLPVVTVVTKIKSLSTIKAWQSLVLIVSEHVTANIVQNINYFSE